MATWQVQEAKARFSELLAQAIDEGPQTITKHGREHVVVVSFDDLRRISQGRQDFRDYLLAGPRVDDFIFERDSDTGRDIAL